MENRTRPIRLFISYASENIGWKDRLLGYMAPSIHAGVIDPWHDRKIEAGEKWKREIFERMNWADAALLLFSKDFFESKFIINDEIPFLRQRHEKNQLPLIPILLDPCDYEPMEFLYSLQLLNEGGTPLSETKQKKQATVLTTLSKRLRERLKTVVLQPDTPDAQLLDTTAPKALIPLSLPQLLEHLPKTNPRIFGREQELEMLDKVRQTKGVLVWVAGGGTGKSALVRHWLHVEKWDEATRFLGHSFYSQGTQDQSTTSAHFLQEALQQLGCTEKILDNFEQGRRLAALVREKPTVLVLDGVEPLQHPPDGHSKLGSLFKDQGLVGLLTELARDPGEAICLVSSRVHLADVGLQEKTGRFIWQHTLDHLTPKASVELLTYRGVNGLPGALEKAAAHYQYHALALVLVSEYLCTFHQGKVEHATEIPLITDETVAGRHAKSVMRAYDNALQKAGEVLDREMVRLLGLFDRPAEPAAMAALKRAAPIFELTQNFHHATDDEVADSLARLRQWGLLNPGGPDAPLDAHPLVREWFGAELHRTLPDSFREAHAVLFQHYQQVPDKTYPDTLTEMEPLYRAIRHGCLEGANLEALHKVYWERIRRGTQHYSAKNLGAHASDLSAITNFFPKGFEQMPVGGLNEAARTWLVSEVSFLLMSLGRLTEAVGPRKVDVNMTTRANKWTDASISTHNLIDLLLPLGRLNEAAEAAAEGLSFAKQTKEWNKNLLCRMGIHAHQGRIAHHQGCMTDAEKAFQQAEGLQAQLQHNLPKLYSLLGTHYALFLLERTDTPARRWAVLDRGRYIGQQLQDHPQENALGKLVTGLAMESLGQGEEAAHTLQDAVADMRRAGMNVLLPWILLAHAGVLHRQRQLPEAKDLLTQAQEIAERGEMRLYLAECHLLAGLIALDEGRQTDAETAHEQAKSLIDEMGYERRRGELLLLESRLFNSQTIREEARQQFKKLGQFGLMAQYHV